MDRPEELVDGLVLPLVAALTAAEAQDDNVAFRVGLNAGAQVADDLLALGGEAVAGRATWTRPSLRNRAGPQ